MEKERRRRSCALDVGSAQALKWTIVVTTHDANPIALCNFPYGLRIISMLKRGLWVFDAQRGV